MINTLPFVHFDSHAVFIFEISFYLFDFSTLASYILSLMKTIELSNLCLIITYSYLVISVVHISLMVKDERFACPTE